MNSYTYSDLLEYNRVQSKILRAICQPLFDNFGFSSFGYTRVYCDGRRLVLETNERWLETYGQANFQEKNDGPNSLLYNISQALAIPSSKEYHVGVLSGHPNNKLHEYLVSIDLWNCLSIYLPMNNYVEVYHFAAPRDNQNVLDIYINKKDLIQRFLHYFREKLCMLDVEKAPYISDKEFSEIFKKTVAVNNESIEQAKIKNYIEQTPFDKFYLKSHDTFITIREMQCLHYLSLGRSFKEIARRLKISPRTVESHINSLKIKTSSISKGELVDIGHKNHITSYDSVV